MIPNQWYAILEIPANGRATPVPKIFQSERPADFPIVAYRRRLQARVDAAGCAEVDGP